MDLILAEYIQTLRHVRRGRKELSLVDRRELPAVHVDGLESVGRGRGARYFLSRRFYSALGQKGVYTRRKGLDRDTNKALLEQHLREQEGGGGALSELRQVLPAESQRVVQKLLDELRHEQRVELKGSKRWATAPSTAIGTFPPAMRWWRCASCFTSPTGWRKQG